MQAIVRQVGGIPWLRAAAAVWPIPILPFLPVIMAWWLSVIMAWWLAVIMAWWLALPAHMRPMPFPPTGCAGVWAARSRMLLSAIETCTPERPFWRAPAVAALLAMLLVAALARGGRSGPIHTLPSPTVGAPATR
jgi:hypothetical protein